MQQLGLDTDYNLKCRTDYFRTQRVNVGENMPYLVSPFLPQLKTEANCHL